MQHTYDLSKPRYTMTFMPSMEQMAEGRDPSSFETLNRSEMAFFLSLGYIASESRWDGQRFTLFCTYVGVC